MLRGIKGYYEGYHSVKIPDLIIEKAVYLSERYITDRFLPDKAIDLLDESCACASLRNKAIDELYITNKKIAKLSQEKEKIEADVDTPDYERLAALKSELAKYQSQSDELCTQAADNTVTDSDLAKVIELWTGIPASKVEETDFEKLRHLEKDILTRIIGQDEAVSLVTKAVKRSRIQTSSHRRPASFIFVGPTGVGKTELAKVLSEQLFNTPETLIRLDMSEFMEKHAVSRIIGAPPGYVGYDEAGQLTEKVRRKPYSVILFDEIEKAHPDVLNVLLQILDDGRITDAQGRKVNFENTIIIMTSNAGSHKTENLMGFGMTEAQASKEKALKALEEFLRPEFIARVDEIVAFAPLSGDSMEKIAALLLDELADVMHEKDISVVYDKKVCKKLCDLAGGGKHGARDLRSQIRKNIEDKIVELLIDGNVAEDRKITITADKEIKVF
ncbi:MAG: ATP-dependent Clp protease ATP-binding subunit [Acutalibacteraceae bacterium]|nr:ATP-dependent Clp protease ATP-binding subunit [Acutalibacteraceae bacterium]